MRTCEGLHPIHDVLAALFMALSPAVFVAVIVVLLGVGLWIARKARHSQRAARANAHVQLVDARSNVAGPMKFHGAAQPRYRKARSYNIDHGVSPQALK